MSSYFEELKLDTNPKADSCAMIKLSGIRFSILTPYLVRIETDKNEIFCDEPTQTVINRNFCKCDFSYETIGDYIIISTKETKFIYNLANQTLESITLYDGRKITDFHKGNLRGTCRTLDNVNGKIRLNEGIISTNGVAVLDDSNSLVLKNNGRVLPRVNSEKDLYYFAYGYKYREAVADLFELTGKAPLIPRYALGNWWSRYKAYTQKEYTELMQRFIDEQIPITVATIDMDWHWVDVVNKFGKKALDRKKAKNLLEVFYNVVLPGWTGYSWNTELFPDHKSFLNWLKNSGFRVTMNLHPASGCKFYEDAYEDFCAFMGIDKETCEQISFDITDEKFVEGYFRYLHHPHENEGVDFWWIDWQQGTKTGIKGLDPLWALNHYHFLDSKRDSKRPLILSRYAGVGSHRYPLGFSGDTVQTWESLDFQPYFTSTASNIAYTWWSHDIGGHCRGYRDDELYLRWLQYGVFSPINRLHSTSNEFMGKEPWMYDKLTEKTAIEFLRFRHRLIPYLYSMNRRTAEEGRALVEPMYYESPKDPRAYKCKNEFLFGSEMIVCPITEKCDEKTGLAGTDAFLPKGRYTDIFTGRIYHGNTLTTLFRDKSTIPVLAKEGAIIPLSNSFTDNSVANPDSMEILICKGNNKFTLYEDDGETLSYKNNSYCETEFEVITKENNVIFRICPAKGDKALVPQSRHFDLSFIDILTAKDISVRINNESASSYIITESKNLKISIDAVSPDDMLEITLTDFTARKNPSKRILQTEIISGYKAGNDIKAALFTKYVKNEAKAIIPSKLKKPLAELEELVY